MLEVKELKKSYGSVQALKGVSFKVNKEVIFGLLGPNGAGKTTTFKIISTLLNPDSGEVYWNGMGIFENKKKWKKIMGYVPQELALYDELTGLENMILMAELYGLKGKDAKDRSLFLLEKIGLKEKMNFKAKTYSGGMKRRLNLIMGIVHNPEIILLDEPTAGIDVQTKIKIYEFIRELVNEGKTILYTTHMLKEAEELFDVVGIIDEGNLKAIGKVDDLISKYAPNVILELRLRGDDKSLSEIEGLGEFDSEKNLLKLEIPSQKDIAKVVENLNSKRIVIESMVIKGASLETVFLKLTGKELRD
ncbi:antibiotic transport system ATP-binding protein [Thermotomaculum hydrothermale]|uniref:Antibiotic transport system ATP-binding protein n=1 Tax=Thermotomaculum hydrothermale TaxID=981385 RepID=A0A7R6PFP2_9BACT|nr:ABC transporter ATP-binding protein [Thermotomaculum hydrothermale]BBB31719.1 antibiotic transport system ATP-binding protein [Thermotomaculum hydrothermale]